MCDDSSPEWFPSEFFKRDAQLVSGKEFAAGLSFNDFQPLPIQSLIICFHLLPGCRLLAPFALSVNLSNTPV